MHKTGFILAVLGVLTLMCSAVAYMAFRLKPHVEYVTIFSGKDTDDEDDIYYY